MNAFYAKHRGFTLVEILIVLAIFGIVTAAVYSLYVVHLKTAFTHDEVVEVQQNLRIAMDSISRDLKMAGLLVPLDINPLTINPGSLQINTMSPDGCVARVANGPFITVDASTSFSLTVDSADSVDGFKTGDVVRIIRPYDNSQPPAGFLGGTKWLVVSGTDRSVPNLTLAISPASTFSGGTRINTGDVIAKAAPVVLPATAPPTTCDTINYSIVTGGNCKVGWCLARQVNATSTSPLPAPASSEIVASNLTNPLGFNFIYDDNTESASPADPNKIKAVRVTINGATIQKSATGNRATVTRRVTSLVKLRNRRIY